MAFPAYAELKRERKVRKLANPQLAAQTARQLLLHAVADLQNLVKLWADEASFICLVLTPRALFVWTIFSAIVLSYRGIF